MTNGGEKGAFTRIFGIPLLIAAITAGGLASALLGEALFWKAIAWGALLLPPLVVAISIRLACRRRNP